MVEALPFHLLFTQHIWNIKIISSNTNWDALNSVFMSIFLVDHVTILIILFCAQNSQFNWIWVALLNSLSIKTCYISFTWFSLHFYTHIMKIKPEPKFYFHNNWLEWKTDNSFLFTLELCKAWNIITENKTPRIDSF